MNSLLLRNVKEEIVALKQLFLDCELDQVLDRANRLLSSISPNNIDIVCEINLLLIETNLKKGEFIQEVEYYNTAKAIIDQLEKAFPSKLLLDYSYQIEIQKIEYFFKIEAFDLAEEAILNIKNENQSLSQQVELIVKYAKFASLKNDIDTANASLEAAFQLVDETIAKEVLLELNFLKMELVQQQSGYANSMGFHAKVLEYANMIGDFNTLQYCIKHEAVFTFTKNQYNRAYKLFHEVKDECTRIGNRTLKAICLINIGTMHAVHKNYDDALKWFGRCKDEHYDVITAKNKIILYNNIGTHLLLKEDLYEAIEAFSKALSICDESTTTALKSLLMAQMGQAHIKHNDIAQGKVYAFQAKDFIDTIANKEKPLKSRPINLMNLAAINYHEGNLEEALVLSNQTTRSAYLNEDAESELEGYRLISIIEKKKNNFQKAIEAQEKYIEKNEAYQKKIRGLRLNDYELKNSQRESEELRAKNNKLEELNIALKEKSKQIYEQNHQLTVVNDQLKQFAYAISHDLRQPIRSVEFYADMVQQNMKDVVEGESKKHLRFLVDGAIRASKLIDGLFEYSTTGKGIVKMKQISIKDILSDVKANLVKQLKDCGGNVIIHEMPEIIGNNILLTQLFQNLISNALKFKRKGIPPVVKVSYQSDIDFHYFEVEDNGIGMPKGNEERIFTIFQRLHKKDSEFEGSGIGLSLCKKIVQLHKGTILVDSILNKGSIFKISISKDLDIIEANQDDLSLY